MDTLSGSRFGLSPPLRGAGAVNRSRTLPKARVTARVRLHERVSRRDQPTSRVGICLMSRSFGTLVQLNTLLQVCTKLGLARDGRMPDLGSDQGAKHKASELRARRGLRLFTELFTVRYTVVTIGSAPGYGHFGSPSSSTGPEGGWGGCRGVREPRKFRPVKSEVISIGLKDSISLLPAGSRACAASVGKHYVLEAAHVRLRQ